MKQLCDDAVMLVAALALGAFAATLLIIALDAYEFDHPCTIYNIIDRLRALADGTK